MTAPPRPQAAWPFRWAQLARAVGVESGERLTIAFSGGADSVLLLHLVADADPRPDVRAVHVNHGLRGEAAAEDADFCRRLCHTLGVPYVEVGLDLDPEAPDLEARAREARYRALCAEARSSGHATLVTGHHADDALETLLMRWVRGSHTSALGGIPRRILLRGSVPGAVEPPPWEEALEEPIVVVRPLIHLRREEVRRILSDRGLDWREDASNRDPRFTRSRVRHALVPALRRVCGEEGLENLRAFGRAVESLEEDLAKRTAHLAWSPPPFALASRPEGGARLGGVLARSELMALSQPLRRRALWRLLVEGTGAAPRRPLLASILEDLSRGRCTRHTLPGRWVLVLRSRELQLLPPPGAIGRPRTDHVAAPRNAPAHPVLPFPRGEEDGVWTEGGLEFEGSHELRPPGIVTLPDGRRLSAEVYRAAPGGDVPVSPDEVELDAEELPPTLTVRWPRSGDRFHPLGAPGTKSLRRFLADAGIPRDERDRVPLVCVGDRILWVVGVRPSERWRVRPTTERRLRLCLHHWRGGDPPAGESVRTPR